VHINKLPWTKEKPNMPKKKVCARMVTLGIITLLVTTCADTGGVKDIATGVSVIGAIPALAGNPVAVGAEIGQGITFIVIGIFELFPTAPANPDAKFTTPAAVVPVHFSLSDTTLFKPNKDALPNGLNESLVAAGKLVDDSRLLNLSLRKYYGALNANDTQSAQLQKGFACLSLNNFNADLRAYSTALSDLSQSAQGTPFASASATVSQVLQLRDQIVQSKSFPASEAFVFTQAHATDQEISLAVSQVATVTGQSLTDSDLTGSVILSRAAAAINGANATQFLPAGFTCADAPTVPALPPFGGIVASLLLLGTGAALILRRRARSSPRV
jgi:hypothetical protein